MNWGKWNSGIESEFRGVKDCSFERIYCWVMDLGLNWNLGDRRLKWLKWGDEISEEREKEKWKKIDWLRLFSFLWGRDKSKNRCHIWLFSFSSDFIPRMSKQEIFHFCCRSIFRSKWFQSKNFSYYFTQICPIIE